MLDELGKTLGTFVGIVESDGEKLGSSEGMLDELGKTLGTFVGIAETDGKRLGVYEGMLDKLGITLGSLVGIVETDGKRLGSSEGFSFQGLLHDFFLYHAQCFFVCGHPVAKSELLSNKYMRNKFDKNTHGEY